MSVCQKQKERSDTAHLLPSPHSVASHWELEMRQDNGIYNMEIAKPYKSGLFFSLESQLIHINTYQLTRATGIGSSHCFRVEIQFGV